MAQSNSLARGWAVTSAAMGVNLILGVLYAWSPIGKMLAGGWIKTYGKTLGQTYAAVPFAVSTAAFAVTMIFAGRLQDKIGPRLVATLGGLLLGAGLITSAYFDSPLALALSYGVLGGIGIGVGYCATTPPAVKWFPPARKGLITGLVVAGVGLAAVYMGPLTNWLLANDLLSASIRSALGLGTSNIAQTFFLLGVLTIVVVSILAQFLRNPPAGYVPPAVEAPAARRRSISGRDTNWPGMLATGQFYLLWCMFILAGAAGLMLIANVMQIAEQQVSWSKTALPAALPVMFLAIFNTCGRVVGGFVSDRIGRTNTMMLAFILQAANMFAFSFYSNPALLLFGVSFAGLCYGSIFTLMPAATADFYGLKNMGVNYGILFTAFGVAGASGALLGGRVRDLFGNYSTAYVIMAVALLVAAAIAALTRAPKVTAPMEAQRELVKSA